MKKCEDKENKLVYADGTDNLIDHNTLLTKQRDAQLEYCNLLPTIDVIEKVIVENQEKTQKLILENQEKVDEFRNTIELIKTIADTEQKKTHALYNEIINRKYKLIDKLNKENRSYRIENNILWFSSMLVVIISSMIISHFLFR